MTILSRILPSAAAILTLVAAGEALAQDEYNAGDGVCSAGFSLISVAEAQARAPELCAMIGAWDIVRLAEGGSLSGSGYGCSVIASDNRGLGGSLCSDVMTPADAAADGWVYRATTVTPQLAETRHEYFELSTPGNDPGLWFYQGDHRGFSMSQSLGNEASMGLHNWIAFEGMYMSIEVVETHAWPYRRFASAEFGELDTVNHVVSEGLTLDISRVNGSDEVAQVGVFNLAQGVGDVAQPASGQELLINGCWTMTTDWGNGPVTHDWNLYADGTGASTATGETITYASMRTGANANTQSYFVAMFPNGTAVGGVLEGTTIDGLGFQSNVHMGVQVPLLDAGYDHDDGSNDPRRGEFSMVYKAPSC